MHVLSDDFCREYRNRVMNVHPSLIPAFCGDGYYGLRVHKSVLDYGVKVTGATVHFVDEGTDGPVSCKKALRYVTAIRRKHYKGGLWRNASGCCFPRLSRCSVRAGLRFAAIMYI